MASHTIYIVKGGPPPPKQQVHRNDSVTFQLEGWLETDTVDVSFNGACCLNQSSFSLYGSSPQAAMHQLTVNADAAENVTYAYTITPEVNKQDDSMPGDLEVVPDTNPPED